MREYCMHCMEPIPSGGTCPHCRDVEQEALDPHLLPAGTLLEERYLVGDVLGQGGFGITYIGRDLTLNIRVAIKEYFPSGYANRNTGASMEVTSNRGKSKGYYERGRKRFLEEARALAQYHGEPGVVEVLNFFEANGTAYIVMEYLQGQTLLEKVRHEGAQSADWAFSAFDPIMDALERMHADGLVHRDVSPDNIMVLEDGTMRLMDFGAARFTSPDSPQTISVMIKGGYTPEEQYGNDQLQGPWTDIYALCATIYKCITRNTPPRTADRSVNDAMKWPSELGYPITSLQEAVLKRGMKLRASDRFQSVAEMRSMLEGHTMVQFDDEEDETAADEAADRDAAAAGIQDATPAIAAGAAFADQADETPTIVHGDMRDAGADETPTIVHGDARSAGPDGTPTFTPDNIVTQAPGDLASHAPGGVEEPKPSDDVAFREDSIRTIAPGDVAKPERGKASSSHAATTPSVEPTQTPQQPKKQTGIKPVVIAVIAVLVILVGGFAITQAMKTSPTASSSSASTILSSSSASAQSTGSNGQTQGGMQVESNAPAVRDSLSKYSWEELDQISELIAAAGANGAIEVAKTYNLANADGTLKSADTKKVTYGGLSYEARIIGFAHDDKADGTGKAGITFQFADCIDWQPVNAAKTNIGGWRVSHLRHLLNNSVPDELEAYVETVTKGAAWKPEEGKDNAQVGTVDDTFWLLSHTEAYGESDVPKWNSEGTQYQLYKEAGAAHGESNTALVKHFNGEAVSWWLRSSVLSNVKQFSDIESTGKRTSCGASEERGVAPCFCI